MHGLAVKDVEFNGAMLRAAQIEDELFGYSNVAERHMKIIIPCTFEGYHGEYKRDVIIYVDTQKMNVSEMRELLNESRAAFSRRYNIPIRTLENWESGKVNALSM